MQGTVLNAKLEKILDPRSPLGIMRRRQLQTVCEMRNVEYQPEEGAEVLRQRLQAAGITGNEPDLSRDGFPTVPPSRLATLNPEKPNYENTKMPELRRVCKQRGIPQKNTDKRVDLIEKLNGQDAS